MDDICRLCCSTKSVSNYIFDEENALFIKMSLYLPIKVFKNDRLPQKICDKCSCKVNDFYQFCNETIEVQNRLQASLLSSEISTTELVDLRLVKENIHSPPPSPLLSHCERSTQTENILLSAAESTTEDDVKNNSMEIKEECNQSSPKLIKTEDSMVDSDNSDAPQDIPSDNSDNMCLINLKKKKHQGKTNIVSLLESNGVVSENKRSRKKKKYKDWQLFMNTVSEGTAFTIVNDNNVPNAEENYSIVKEVLDIPQNFSDLFKDIKAKKESTEGDSYTCCICFEQFFNRSSIMQHYREHATKAQIQETPTPSPVLPPIPKQRPLKCTRCQKVLTEKEWGKHWRQHWERDRRPYRCSLCEKTFREASQILKHGMTHKLGENGTDTARQQDKRFVCDLCPEGFVYMRYLLSHRTSAHPDAASRPLTLRCAQCSREFAHLNSLRRHLRAHSGERNFLCNVCGKSLSSREHLKFHIRIHTGDKPNVCKTCGKGFVKKCNLTLHERVHSGEKPHVCSHCGKAFSQRSTLVIHERYHSGQRPYVCGLCGRGFVAKGLLSMHLKTTCI